MKGIILLTMILSALTAFADQAFSGDVYKCYSTYATIGADTDKYMLTFTLSTNGQPMNAKLMKKMSAVRLTLASSPEGLPLIVSNECQGVPAASFRLSESSSRSRHLCLAEDFGGSSRQEVTVRTISAASSDESVRFECDRL